MGESRYKTIVPDIEFWKGMIPCQAACPIRTDAGKYVQLIAEGGVSTGVPGGTFAKPARLGMRPDLRRTL